VLPVVLKAIKKGKFKNLLSQVSVPGPSGPSCFIFQKKKMSTLVLEILYKRKKDKFAYFEQ